MNFCILLSFVCFHPMFVIIHFTSVLLYILSSKLIYTFSGWSESITAIEQVSIEVTVFCFLKWRSLVFPKIFSSNISNMNGCGWSHFQILRRELKILHTAKYFWRTLRIIKWVREVYIKNENKEKNQVISQVMQGLAII